MAQTRRDDFLASVVASLAKRSGYKCALCRAVTVGPSRESPQSVSNLGVAAHISAAAPGGKRYDASLSSAERRSIANAIWLCQTDGKRIDADAATYTTEVLREAKAKHEAYISTIAGVPEILVHPNLMPPAVGGRGMTALEYAFLPVANAGHAYKQMISPILRDRHINDAEEIGVLMCHGPARDEQPGPEWTVFVTIDWLKWLLAGQNAGYRAADTLSPSNILGCIPGWPDSFYEWLTALVQTNSTFTWQRHPDGYLVLAQEVLQDISQPDA